MRTFTIYLQERIPIDRPNVEPLFRFEDQVHLNCLLTTNDHHVEPWMFGAVLLLELKPLYSVSTSCENQIIPDSSICAMFNGHINQFLVSILMRTFSIITLGISWRIGELVPGGSMILSRDFYWSAAFVISTPAINCEWRLDQRLTIKNKETISCQGQSSLEHSLYELNYYYFPILFHCTHWLVVVIACDRVISFRETNWEVLRRTFEA